MPDEVGREPQDESVADAFAEHAELDPEEYERLACEPRGFRLRPAPSRGLIPPGPGCSPALVGKSIKH
ncbi:MAG TPA: hypothetical protein VGG35_24435 [Streptosporangiaceae bacterium]|jgi:hypothetical protein